jgi:hypothetical protein
MTDLQFLDRIGRQNSHNIYQNSCLAWTASSRNRTPNTCTLSIRPPY